MSQFDALPPKEDLWLQNDLSVQLVAAAAALNCSILDVLDEWGEVGRSREQLIRKANRIHQANAAHDRKMFQRQRSKDGEGKSS